MAEISKKRKKRIIQLRIKITLFCLGVVAVIYFAFHPALVKKLWNRAWGIEQEETEPETEVVVEEEPEEIPVEVEETTELVTRKPTTDEIYAFMQGPVAWKNKALYSGEWCEFALAGSKFSVFGCGLCDLASIYSTISPYDCSPIDMYDYAREVSAYSPGGGTGAIDWPDLAATLRSCGFDCDVFNKDETYEEFQDQMDSAITAIALVSKYDDPTYWSDTDGHYVNIWSYDRERDEVFLGDSGNPSHNQCWIPLSTVYSALKTSGSYQYLLVYSYNEEENTWKHDGITEEWTYPDGYEEKLAAK